MSFWEDLGDTQAVVFILTKGWLYDHSPVTSGRSGQFYSEGLWGKCLSEEMAPAHNIIMGTYCHFRPHCEAGKRKVPWLRAPLAFSFTVTVEVPGWSDTYLQGAMHRLESGKFAGGGKFD